MDSIIIGIDHGYGNIKTAHFCFTAGVIAHEKEPAFRRNLLFFDGKYYAVGENRKAFAADKMADQDYYLLTLAGIAMELGERNLSSARVHLAAGLPLTWVSVQKEGFRNYLLQQEEADFTFKGEPFHVEFDGADIYPQGFSAVGAHLMDFTGTTMLCDIGSGTMNIMYIVDRRPVQNRCYTEKFGTYQCLLTVREKLLRRFGTAVDDSIIEHVLRSGGAEVSDRYLAVIRESASAYVEGIFRRLRDHEYDPEVMRLYIVGGGGCLVKNFGVFEPGRVTISEDICATAKGYEALAAMQLSR